MGAAPVAPPPSVILLATARALLGDGERSKNVRLLCDPGSQATFITERVVKSMQLRWRNHRVPVVGLGAHLPMTTRGSVNVRLTSVIDPTFSIEIEAHILPCITSAIPATRVHMGQWRHLRDLALADPQFGEPSRIDLLIGADSWGYLVESDVIHGGVDEPHAQRTRLGWVIFGPAPPLAEPTLSLRVHSAYVTDPDLDERLEELVRSFWNLEEDPTPSPSFEDCEQIFTDTHYRTADGRYVVCIPFVPRAEPLGSSYSTALKQFIRLERRLAGSAELRANYVAFMREYEALGHMERHQQKDPAHHGYYIPHHAVSPKFRVVFNASSKTTSGLSLNDVQAVGPTIQDSLLQILYRFRQRHIALSADVEKMFRQVKITPEHRQWQRILWRETPTEPLREYQLTTVTYGMASSPFNAVRALQQCALDNAHQVADPAQALVARESIFRSFYVDDYLTSCDYPEEAYQLAADVETVLAAGQFRLHKWNSNDADLTGKLTGRQSSITEHRLPGLPTSVLGLHWDPVADELFYKVPPISNSRAITKRQVLSDIAKLFDPTGLLAPVVMLGKMLLQTIWSTGIDWDTPLPADIVNQWQTCQNGLAVLNELRVPRWLGVHSGAQVCLHGFCDASSRGYAAVIYVHTTNAKGAVQITLVTARTKVAPLQGNTIPRLELCAAQLLAQTMSTVRAAMQLEDVPCCLWSDSQVVLWWISKPRKDLKPYVANRVHQVQTLTSRTDWHYVRSKDNPADCASRGLTAPELCRHQLWWQGPAWLRTEPGLSEVELNLSEVERDLCSQEVRISLAVATTALTHSLTIGTSSGAVIPITERFSCLSTLLRVVAIVRRFTTPRAQRTPTRSITVQEQDLALMLLIRLEQQIPFKEELQCIRKGAPIAISSALVALNPFLADDGIMRVGGRLTEAQLPFEQRFPAILPKAGALTQLLIRHSHHLTLHGGTQLMLQTLRRRYWIIHARQAVRSHIHACTVCRRHRGTTLRQQMAPLPGQRVTSARPFFAAGVDYCGPFHLRTGGPRSRTTVKTYVAIFICMATKAVHIEVVHDLSSRAFLDAFTRFVSRRGRCRDMYSDHGTAFHGANRLLREDLAAWHHEHTRQSIEDGGTTWHFISPRAPHQGGLWEAAVKSAKRHLTKMIGAQTIRVEQMQTLMTRIEACLNSRPLVALHDDPEDRLALTPGDFLIGEPLLAVPEPSIRDIPINRLKQHQYLRKLHQYFWQRWSNEYLSTLQTRNKWQRRSAEIRINDIVAVKDDNLPPTRWRLGRVLHLHPGRDGLPRNVTLWTLNGTCVRAVQKLCRILDESSFEPAGSTGQDVPDSNRSAMCRGLPCRLR